jgi:hypothetical protein
VMETVHVLRDERVDLDGVQEMNKTSQITNLFSLGIRIA